MPYSKNDVEKLIKDGYNEENRNRLVSICKSIFGVNSVCDTCPNRFEDAYQLLKYFIKKNMDMPDSKLKKYEVVRDFLSIAYEGNVYTPETITDEDVEKLHKQHQDLYFKKKEIVKQDK